MTRKPSTLDDLKGSLRTLRHTGSAMVPLDRTYDANEFLLAVNNHTAAVWPQF